MGAQWKYLWPVLVLAVALTLGLRAALRFLRPISLGERISVAKGAPLRQVVVEYSDGGGHSSHESNEPALLVELPSLLADTRLRYDGLTDGGAPVSPIAYIVTVYFALAEEGRTFGVDSQGRVYQDNRRYPTSPEQVEELTAFLKRICS